MHTGQHKNACIIDCTYLWNLGLIKCVSTYNLEMKNVNKSEIKSTYSKLQKTQKITITILCVSSIYLLLLIISFQLDNYE